MEPSLINRIVAIASWLSFSTHVLLEIFVSLGACRGGEVGQVGNQVVLVERSGDDQLAGLERAEHGVVT